MPHHHTLKMCRFDTACNCTVFTNPKMKTILTCDTIKIIPQILLTDLAAKDCLVSLPVSLPGIRSAMFLIACCMKAVKGAKVGFDGESHV